MNLKDLAQDELDAWRVNPVTEILKDCLWKAHKAQKEMCLESYWSGNPWPESDLASLRRMEGVLEDIFEASTDDLKSVMEQIDELRKSFGDHPD